MISTGRATRRILLSVALSVSLSVATTWLLRAILTAALEKSGSPDDTAAHLPGPPRPRPGQVINPVNVFVFIPVLVGNNYNAVGRPARGSEGGRHGTRSRR